MAQEQQVAKVKISKQSVFKIKDLYDFYFNLMGSLGFDVFEDYFTKKDDDTIWEWTCRRWVDDYFHYKFWTKVKVLGAKDVKVKREGVEEPMVKAEVVISIKAKIVTDWQNRWGTNPLTKFFKGLFDKYLVKNTTDDRKKELREKVYVVENELKSYFELPRFL